MKNTQVTILTNNQAVLRAIRHPQQQPGQMHISKIYEAIRRAKEQNNSFGGIWLPAGEKSAVSKLAKKEAKLPTQPERPMTEQLPGSRRAFTDTIRSRGDMNRGLPKGTGKYSKELDAALPGKHTRMLYNNLKRDEARTLAQLRTGMSQLNEYLYRIGARESTQCACGTGVETTRHFLFHCPRWSDERAEMRRTTTTRWGDLSFFLGGRSSQQTTRGPLDPLLWKPEMGAVQATIRYAMKTGRLAPEQEPPPN